MTIAPELSKPRDMKKTDQILRGAMEEFLARGYAAASMDRVAAAAGVSKATVYSYFADKETLFTTLVETMARERFQSVRAMLDESKEPRLAIRQLLTIVMEDCCSNGEFHNFKRVLVGESGRFPELAKTFVEHLSKPGVEAIAEYFRNNPAFNFPDPEATARILIGSVVDFAMLQNIMHGDAIMPMEQVRIIDALEYLLFDRP
jgi:TetR/AcrR family transcriptional regulator, regulator of autoinduction and epiphytic fitness